MSNRITLVRSGNSLRRAYQDYPRHLQAAISHLQHDPTLWYCPLTDCAVVLSTDHILGRILYRLTAAGNPDELASFHSLHTLATELVPC